MIVVTGFKPWGRYSENPSGAVAESLDGLEIGGEVVHSVTLPVSYRAVGDAVAGIYSMKPGMVLHLGLDASTPSLKVEQVALNMADAGPDVEGVEKRGEPVVAGGPAAYMASIPVRRVVDGIRGAGVPARISYTAGTYLCNYLFYLSLHHAPRGTPVGFIHVPRTPGMALEGRHPSMPLQLVRRGVVEAIKTVLG